MRKKVAHVVYAPAKHIEAIDWLEEHDTALARAAGTRATIAMVISIISLVVAVAFGVLPYILAKPHG